MRKKVLKDIMKLMYPSFIMETLYKIISGYLIIFIGSTIGDFANSVMSRNTPIAKKDIIFLVFALTLSIFALPLFDVFSKCTMFKQSLKHDRIIFSNFIEKDYSKAMVYEVGEISYRLETDPIELRWYLIDAVKNSIAFIVVSIGLVISLMNINHLYGAVCLVVAALPLFVAFFVSKFDAKYRPQIKEYEEKNRELEANLCLNFVFIKMYKLKKLIIKEISEFFNQHYNKTIKKSTTYKNVGSFLNDLLASVSVIIVLVFGAYLVSKKVIKPGVIATMLFYLELVKSQYNDLSEVIRVTALLPQSLDRVAELYKNKEEEGSSTLSKFETMKVENLSYSYDEEKNIFQNISFEINQGEKLAIIGKNGGGKSTIIKILTGLYTNYGGQFKINNADFKTLNLSDWRNKIAYLEQEPYIFKATVYENVRLGNLQASEEEIKKILKLTGLQELANKVAQQFGDNLSGGERQRISIARALLKKSNILFVDEPFNNLDFLGKALIEQIFSDENKTIIFISHDEELLKFAEGTVNI